MSSKNETMGTGVDTLKLLISLAIIVAAVVVFYINPEQPLLLRIGALLAGAGIAVAIALQTNMGRNAWAFLHGTQIEVRKVVWPTRQETVQVTLIVIIVVILVSIILWLLDIFLGWTIGSLMGRKG